MLAQMSDVAGMTLVGTGMVILSILLIILVVTWIAFPFIVKKRLDLIVEELRKLNARWEQPAPEYESQPEPEQPA